MGRLLNYGLIEKKSKGYRRALRQCKKNKRLYGASFDNSETWYLDIVFYKYCRNHNLSKHKFLNNFITYSYEDDVIEEVCKEINGSYLDNWELVENRLALITQDVNNDILQHINKKQLEDVCNFLVPRLKAFKDITMAYPPDLTWEQWEEYIQNTIDEMDQKKTINLFLDRIHDFSW